MVRNQYTITDVAERVGVGPWTLRRLERLGHIPAARRDPFSRKRVYTDADVEHVRSALAVFIKQRTGVSV